MVGVCTRKCVYPLPQFVDINWWWTRTTRKTKWLSAPTSKIYTLRFVFSEAKQLTKWTTTLISTSLLPKWMEITTPILVILHQKNWKEPILSLLWIMQMTKKGQKRTTCLPNQIALAIFPIIAVLKTRNAPTLTLIKIWLWKCLATESSSKRGRWISKLLIRMLRRATSHLKGSWVILWESYQINTSKSPDSTRNSWFYVRYLMKTKTWYKTWIAAVYPILSSLLIKISMHQLIYHSQRRVKNQV